MNTSLELLSENNFVKASKESYYINMIINLYMIKIVSPRTMVLEN